MFLKSFSKSVKCQKGFQSHWKTKRFSQPKSQNSKPSKGLPIKASQKAKGFSKSIQGKNPKPAKGLCLKAKRFSKPVKGQIDYSCLIYPDILKNPVKQLFSTVRENPSDGFQGGWGTPQGAVYPTPPGDLSIHPSTIQSHTHTRQHYFNFNLANYWFPQGSNCSEACPWFNWFFFFSIILLIVGVSVMSRLVPWPLKYKVAFITQIIASSLAPSPQIHFAIWTNTFCNLDKYIWQLKQHANIPGACQRFRNVFLMTLLPCVAEECKYWAILPSWMTMKTQEQEYLHNCCPVYKSIYSLPTTVCLIKDSCIQILTFSIRLPKQFYWF